MTLTHLAGKIRRSPLLRTCEPYFQRLEPVWNRVLDARARGLLAHVNGDPLRLTYTYGARYEKSGYEPAVHRAFTTRIAPGMIVVDVGAHIGFFTLAEALHVGPTGRVFAFEPA